MACRGYGYTYLDLLSLPSPTCGIYSRLVQGLIKGLMGTPPHREPQNPKNIVGISLEYEGSWYVYSYQVPIVLGFPVSGPHELRYPFCLGGGSGNPTAAGTSYSITSGDVQLRA